MSSVNKRTALIIVWIVVLIGIYAVVTRFNGNAPPTPPKVAAVHLPGLNPASVAQEWSQIVAHSPAPARGLKNAPFTMVECGDFQCPQCGKMRPVLEGLLKAQPKRVNMLFLERPFPGLHKWAVASAQASLAAAQQGKFWQMYDLLYTHQDDLEPGYYDNYAASAGMNVKQFDAAMKDKPLLMTVHEDAGFADQLDIKVTPTVLVRNNKTNVVTIYVGSNSAKPDAIAGYLGIEQLAIAPPWLAAPTPAPKKAP